MFKAIDENHIQLRAKKYEDGSMELLLKNWNMSETIYFDFDKETLENFKNFLNGSKNPHEDMFPDTQEKELLEEDEE